MSQYSASTIISKAAYEEVWVHSEKLSQYSASTIISKVRKDGLGICKVIDKSQYSASTIISKVFVGVLFILSSQKVAILCEYDYIKRQ